MIHWPWVVLWCALFFTVGAQYEARKSLRALREIREALES